MSPLRLLNAVLSCTISTSIVRSVAFFLFRAFLVCDPRAFRFPALGVSSGASAFSGTPRFKMTVSVSSWESICPSPRNPEDPSAAVRAARPV